MPRPTLVVGIGGTGQWVLTWLKRDLVETFGKVPPQVQLLAFDTTVTVEATSQTVGGEDTEEARARIGDVVLEEKTEFIHLGGDSYEFAKQIQEGAYPEIGRWFEAKFWLSKLNPAAFILEQGAGRIRPLGRLALFQDMVRRGGTHVLTPLRTKIHNVQNALQEESGRKVNIILAASFAGGTGSGMFLDIALLLHLLAQKSKLDYHMIGFFVLPWAFTANPSDEMLARSFAAWRELNRFMVVREDFPLPPMIYDPENPDMRFTPTRRLFDYAYLVDGRLQTTKGFLREEAPYGSHPAVANAIMSLYIDEHASRAYAEKVLINLHPVFARNPGNPLYSTFGLKMVKNPAYYIEEQTLLILGQEIIHYILQPMQSLEFFRVAIEDPNWLLNIAAVDRNPEKPGARGREEAPKIFGETLRYKPPHYTEELVGKPTLFINRLGQLLEAVREDRQATIEALARAGLKGGRGWAPYFPNLGDDPKYQRLREQVETQIKFNVIKAYSRRKGEKAPQARRRLKDLPEDVRRRFGITTLVGKEQEEYTGEFGEILDKIRVAQVDIFRHLLRLRLLRILNGDSPDPLVARVGKLGYALDFVDGLVDTLGQLIHLIEDVRQYREQKVRPEAKIAERLNRAERALQSTHNKKLCFLCPFIEHPQVRKAERLYLRAWQDYIDIRRENLMLRAIKGTIEDMREVARVARRRLQNWILHLSAGDTAAHVPGLWKQIQNRRQILDEVLNYDKRLRYIQALLEEPEFMEHVRKQHERFREILERLNWEVTLDLRIAQIWQPRLENEEAITLEDPFLEPEEKWREERASQNFQTFHTYLEPYSAQFTEQTRIAERIKREFGREQKAVHQFIMHHGLHPISPLALLKRDMPAKKSTFLGIQTTDENDPFFYGATGLEGEMRRLYNLPQNRVDDAHPVMTVNFENPHKFIAIHTSELFPPTQFQGWVEAQNAYIKHMDQEFHELNPVHLHILGAEALAVEFERRLVQEKGQAYRALSPRIVMLLENRQRLSWFLWLLALKYIQETPKEELPYRWELVMPDNVHPRIWLTRGWSPHEASEQKRPRPDILDAAHGFVIHGRTFEPAHSWRIQYNKIEQWLQDYRKRIGRDAWVAFLKEQLAHKEGSLLHELKGLAARVATEVAKEEIESLYWVAHLLIEEELKWWTT